MLNRLIKKLNFVCIVSLFAVFSLSAKANPVQVNVEGKNYYIYITNNTSFESNATTGVNLQSQAL